MMRCRLLLVVALTVLGGSVGAGDALAQSPDPRVEARIRTVLLARDSNLEREAWLRMGPQTAVILQRAAADQGLPWGARTRAFAVLGHFPTPATRAFLEASLADRQLPAMLKAAALRGFAVAFAASDPVATRKLADGFAADPDERVRLAAHMARVRAQQAGGGVPAPASTPTRKRK